MLDFLVPITKSVLLYNLLLIKQNTTLSDILIELMDN